MANKVLRLELLKFRNYKPFWIILGLFTVSYFAVGLSIKRFIDWVVKEDSDLGFFINSGLPVFDFIDIWQNLAYVTFLFKYILAFVIIISICTEFSNKTYRQNLIDGLSRLQFLGSKLVLIFGLSVFGGILLTVLGLILGLLYSPVKAPDFIVANMEYVGAYMLEITVFLCIGLFFAVLIRRTGFAIILFILYSLVIEPILTAVMMHNYNLKVWYFPIKAVNNLIRVPFQKYIFREVRDFVALQDILIALGWSALFIYFSYLLLARRDA